MYVEVQHKNKITKSVEKGLTRPMYTNSNTSIKTQSGRGRELIHSHNQKTLSTYLRCLRYNQPAS